MLRKTIELIGSKLGGDLDADENSITNIDTVEYNETNSEVSDGEIGDAKSGYSGASRPGRTSYSSFEVGDSSDTTIADHGISGAGLYIVSAHSGGADKGWIDIVYFSVDNVNVVHEFGPTSPTRNYSVGSLDQLQLQFTNGDGTHNVGVRAIEFGNA